jgi:hypothetical protein
MQLRKTAVLFGSAALAAALSGCVVPIGPTSAPVPSPTASRSGAAKPSASASPSATAVVSVLGPSGVGDLALGMTKAQANRTGQASGVTGDTGTCGASGDGRLLGAQPADASDLDGKLFFSTATGKLVIIGATASIATPEGVHLGSTITEVKKAYPKWKGSDAGEGLDYVKVPGNAAALYRIYVDAGQVLELTLQAVDQDCAE